MLTNTPTKSSHSTDNGTCVEAWIQSSFCNSNACVQWGNSTHCDNSQCVEHAHDGDIHMLRDSKDADGPYLSFTTEAWTDFISAIKRGELVA